MTTEREKIARRLSAADLLEDRFIPVKTGEKGSPVKHRNRANRYGHFGAIDENYGVYAGPNPDGTEWLIDVDIDDYGDDVDDDALQAVLELPETLTVASPHTDGETGGHRYYAVECDDLDEQLQDLHPRGKTNFKPPWGELRVQNQYVVGPGSQLDGCDKEWCDECATEDGGKYTVAIDAPIETLDVEDVLDVLRAAGYDGSADDGQDADLDDYEPSPDPNRAERVAKTHDWVQEYLLFGASDRSSKDFAVCCKMIEYGVADNDARQLLENSSKTKVSERGHDYWRETWNNAKREVGTDAGTEELAGEQSQAAEAGTDGGTTTTDASGAGPTGVATWDSVCAKFESEEKGSTTKAYDLAARKLDEIYNFVAIRDTGELYYYNPDLGYYVRKGKTFIAELLQDHTPGHVNNNRRRNIYEQVKALNYVEGDEFTPPKGKVCVENGVLNLETRELEDHKPKYHFTSRLQTPYDADADADLWCEFLEESTAPDEMKKLEEFIGYSLEVWHHEREKNLFIVGPRQSGKSTFTETVQALFGQMPTVTNLTPQQIADTQFDAASLKEAMLNTVNDINASKIEDTGTLKRVFSGERQKLERKFQDATFGAPKAKHMFSANWLPSVVGQDESLYRRVLIVEFPNKVDDEDRDEKLKGKLQEELSGVLNRALDARDRLHEQGGFTNDRDDTATRQKWDSWRDAHKRFLYTQFEITGDSDDVVEKGTYYQAYKEFAGREGYELKPKQAVTKSLQWVPEIAVNEDHYAGLEWLDVDAASSSHQTGLPSQNERVTKTLGWIDEFTTPSEYADREDVLAHAEECGYDRGKVSAAIDNLLKKGELDKPQSGKLRKHNS